MILTDLPSRERMMFDGDRSRWRIPRTCAASIASQI